MMKNYRHLLWILLMSLASCATNGPMKMQFIQKDNTKIYHALWIGKSFGNPGSMSIDLAGKRYQGEPIRVDEANLFGLKSRYGIANRQLAGSSLITSFYRALLVNEEGLAMRCDFYIDYTSGSGLCVDESQKIYEVYLAP